MAVTYEPIASQTLGSSASSVEFTSISGSFTDLVLVCRTTLNAGGYVHQVQFNSDTGSNYSYTVLWGSGSSAGSTRAGSQSQIFGSYQGVPGSTNPDVTIMHIMSYASTNVHKTLLSSAAGPDFGVDRIVGLWRSTSAITSIKLTPSASKTYSSGSTFSLYGIKAA